MKRIILLFFVFLLAPSLCYAYVGPGVGLTVITSILALGSAFFITLFGFIWLPLKRFFKGEDNDSSDDSEEDEETTDTDAEKDKNTDR